jgi:hypothetical protein
MKPRLSATLLFLFLFLGLSCGQAEEPAQQANIIQVGIEDLGGTFDLRPGDRLVISLREESSGAHSWEVAGYPEEVLDVVASDEDSARFEFVAAGEGGGPVQLTGRPTCQRGQTDSEGEIQCPLLGAGAGGAPFRLFVITVRVNAG